MRHSQDVEVKKATNAKPLCDGTHEFDWREDHLE
jgi:CDGSH-type Zn-finger protein